jgi:hypothetical protein
MTPHPPTETTLGLQDLDHVVLRPKQEAALARLRELSIGPPPWRARKEVELRELLALECLAERLTVLAVDAIAELRAIVRLQVPVPCLPPGAHDVVVEPEAELVLSYPEAILSGPLPGHALVGIVRPSRVHHPNVDTSVQRVCLGASIPRGYPLKEALLASHAALSFQSIQLDERDAAGVMNVEAARFWQAAAHRLLAPLRAGDPT